MLYCLRPPELLHLRIDHYTDLCIRDHQRPPETLTTTHIWNWIQYGLRDLYGHRVWLTREFFTPEHRPLAERLAQVLPSETLLADADKFIASDGTACTWLAGIIKLHTQPRLFVTGKLAPMHKHKWVAQQLLLGSPFDDEETLLHSPDPIHRLSRMGRIDLQNPLHTLADFVLNYLVYWPVPYSRFWQTIRDSWVALQAMASGTDEDFFHIDLPATEEQMVKDHDMHYSKFQTIVNDSHHQNLLSVPPWRQDELQSNESWKEQQDCFALIQALSAYYTLSTAPK